MDMGRRLVAENFKAGLVGGIENENTVAAAWLGLRRDDDEIPVAIKRRTDIPPNFKREHRGVGLRGIMVAILGRGRVNIGSL